MSEEKNISSPADASANKPEESQKDGIPITIGNESLKELHEEPQHFPEDKQAPVTPSTSNQQQETENMEIHHKHHHDPPGKKEKHWKHYLFEFLMLFLAVTAGFFVENQREHYIEHKRAKAFARLLTDDLAADIAELSRAGRMLNQIIVAGDSLGRLLTENDSKNIPGGKLYYYEYWSGWRWSIISRDATLQQLKNSGALRYMGNTSLIKKILDYEETIKLIYMFQNKYEPEKTENWNLVQKVFDQGYFNMLDSIKAAARDSSGKSFDINDKELVSFLNSDYPLFSYEKNIWHELKNWAYNSSRNYRVQLRGIISAKQKARDLIEALKKEYDLK